MKLLYVLLLLFIVSVSCNERINLDNIDRDQLESEITSSKNSASAESTDETQYSANPESSQSQHEQQQYHDRTTPPQELGNQLGDYAELQPYESFKYAPHLTNPTQQNQQYYIQEDQSHSAQNDYEILQRQQQLYQHEMIGSKLQSLEHKAMTHKNIDENSDKVGTFYVNIPMNQLLDYYQNNGIISSKSKNDEQISIPINTPYLSENQIYASGKVSYQPQFQYVSSYPKYTQAIFTKELNVANSPITHTSQQLLNENQQKYTLPIKILMNPVYESLPSSSSSLLYKPQKYRHYKSDQSYPHYGFRQHQQFFYVNPETTYIDIYSMPAAPYIQDNSLNTHKNQYYVPVSYSRKLMMQIMKEARIRNTEKIQQIIKQEEQEQPVNQDFSSPQYPAQKLHSTNLVPLPSTDKGLSSKLFYSAASSSLSSSSSQPKTLLDSYIPSHVIAAQDVNRYRERPIKLESGFLPSKIKFIRSYKKRKTE